MYSKCNILRRKSDEVIGITRKIKMVCLSVALPQRVKRNKHLSLYKNVVDDGLSIGGMTNSSSLLNQLIGNTMYEFEEQYHLKYT